MILVLKPSFGSGCRSYFGHGYLFLAINWRPRRPDLQVRQESMSNLYSWLRQRVDQLVQVFA